MSHATQFGQSTTPDEAETWACMAGEFDSAFDAAGAAGFQLRYYEGEAFEWLERAWQGCAIVALE